MPTEEKQSIADVLRLKLTEENVADVKQAIADTLRLKASIEYPGGIMARKEIPRLSGFTIAVGTVANDECRGNGPKGGFSMCRKRCYTVENAINYIVSKIEA